MQDYRQQTQPEGVDFARQPRRLVEQWVPPDVARYWVPYPVMRRDDIGWAGYLAWVWRAAWCPFELARIDPAKVVEVFSGLGEEIEAEYEALVGRFNLELSVREPWMEPAQRENEARRRAERIIVPEWIEVPAEVEARVFCADFLEGIESAAAMPIGELAELVVSWVGHQPSLLRPTPWRTDWAMTSDELRELLRWLHPVERHMVYCEARRQVYAHGLHRDGRFHALAAYPAPDYRS